MYERLTYREELGVVLVKGVDEKRCHVHCTEKRHSGDIAEDCMNCEINKAFERLATYEDSELSPNEVQSLAQAKADGRLVEVVRCGECRHYNTTGCSDGCGWCENMDRGVFDEHYCSRGERRGEGMIPIGKSKQTVVEHLRDMLADPLCLDEMTGYQENAVEKVIVLLDGIEIGRLEAICDAERGGPCVVLPCKIGEKVYRYCNDAINEGTIINILLNVKTGEIGLEYEMPTCYTCSRSGTLGKNLFLTREAAEKALGVGE